MQIFKQAYIKLDEERYLALVTILIPLINFLSGIVIDMYAPSMPQIAIYFHTSAMLVKNTITATILGYPVGAIFLGILFDIWGRRKVVIFALIFFIIVSLLAPQCHNIYYLIVIRFIQGLAGAAMSVGCRVIASDHFTGKQMTIVLLYASLAFGIGTVISPFIGGYLQYHFGWQANFYAFTIFAIVLLSLFSIFVHERFQSPTHYEFKHLISAYKETLQHRKFWAGMLILAIAQLQLLFYPTIAPFLVEHQLHYSAITYGNTAVIVGLGFLVGTFSNRLLLHFFSQKRLTDVGFLILALVLLIQFIFATFYQLNLWYLTIPIVFICYGDGFLIGNISSTCIQLFSKNVGIVTSIQLCVTMLLSSVGNFLISSLTITSLHHVFFISLAFILLQGVIYFIFFRKVFI